MIFKYQTAITHFNTFLLILLGLQSYSQTVKIYNVNCHIPKYEYRLFSNHLHDQIKFFEKYFELADTFQVNASFVGDDSKIHLLGEEAHGLFSYETNRITIYKTYRYHEIFKHEINHWIYSKFNKIGNRQVGEGLAELFENSFYIQDSLLFSFDRNQVLAVQKHLKLGIDLKTWLSQSNQEFCFSQKSRNYQIAWALIYYLYYERPLVFERVVFPSNPSSNLVERVASSYRGGIHQLQKDLESYFSALSFHSFSKGLRCLQAQKVDSAVFYFKESIEKYPYLAESHLYLGIALEELGQTGQSKEHYDQAYLIAPRLEKVTALRKALLAIDRWQYDLCIQHLFAQLQFANTNEEKYTVYNSLGVAYSLSFRPIQSIKAHRKAQALNPKENITNNNLANAFLMIDELDSCVHYASLAIKKNKKFANSYAHRGMAYYLQGKQKKAFKNLEKAEKLNPSYAFTHLYKGIAYQKANQEKLSKESFIEVFESQPLPIAISIASGKLSQLGLSKEEIEGLYRSGSVETPFRSLEMVLSDMNEYDRVSKYSGKYDLFN